MTCIWYCISYIGVRLERWDGGCGCVCVWYLGVSVDGGVVQRRVVVESLSVAVGACTQQFTRHSHTPVIARLV